MCLREGQTRRNGGRKRSVLEYMSILSPFSKQYGRVQIHFVQSLTGAVDHHGFTLDLHQAALLEVLEDAADHLP